TGLVNFDHALFLYPLSPHSTRRHGGPREARMNDLVQIVLAAIIPVILAITWATAAEAYAAHHFGDNTGRMMGRLTLNPFVHLNVLGTVIVPAAVFLMSKGMVLFGWG